MKRSSIPSLTGIRGIAAVLVVAYHLSSQTTFGLATDVPLISQGSFGVDLFFILSGFILMYVHGRDFQTITGSGLAAFFRLRFFRVYPVHITVMILMLCFVTAFPLFVPWFRSLPAPPFASGLAYSTPGFFQTLTLTNRIGLPDLGEWNGPSWSLSSEIVGYVAFPFLANRITRLRSTALCYAIATVCLSLFCFILVARGHIGMPRMLFCFLAGMAIGQAQQLQPEPFAWANPVTVVGAAIAVVCLLTPALAPMSVFGFAAVIYGLATGPSIVRTVLETRPVMFLGRISFSLYLTHYLLLYVLEWVVFGGEPAQSQPALAATGYVCVCLCVATAVHYAVEKPFHSLGRQLGHRDSLRSASRAAAQQAL